MPPGHEPIIQAAFDRNHRKIERILRLNPQQLRVLRHPTGDTALHVAALRDDPESAEVLLKAGLNVQLRNVAGETPLHHANSARMVRLLLAHGASACAVSAAGKQPIHMATDSDALAALIEAGADVNASSDSDTPLLAAAYRRDEASVELLLRHGANVHAVDRYGRSVLDAALRPLSYLNEAPIERMIARLVRAGASRLDAKELLRKDVAAPSMALRRMISLLIEAGIFDPGSVTIALDARIPPLLLNPCLLAPFILHGLDVNACDPRTGDTLFHRVLLATGAYTYYTRRYAGFPVLLLLLRGVDLNAPAHTGGRTHADLITQRSILPELMLTVHAPRTTRADVREQCVRLYRGFRDRVADLALEDLLLHKIP